MGNQVRLGFVGANVKSKWGIEGHFPAVQACPDVEMTAVCTTNPVSAEEARVAFGARLAFSDYREMVTSPEIDAVVVCVRVPSHHPITIAALAAGKHVYTEWPLGRTIAEAEEMAALARAKGLKTAVGLQSRVTPALQYAREMIESGSLGDVLTCHVTCVRKLPLAQHSSRSYMADVNSGANTLTKHTGHMIDSMRFLLGEFAQLGAQVSTQARKWTETDTGKTVDVTAPDTVLLTGHLQNGTVMSGHIAPAPWASPGYRIEVYGTEGTMVVSGTESPQRHEPRLQVALRGNQLQDIEVPEARFTFVPPGFPRGTPFHVGQMYTLFARAIQTGQTPPQLPTFDTALGMHRLIETMRLASELGRSVPVDLSHPATAERLLASQAA